MLLDDLLGPPLTAEGQLRSDCSPLALADEHRRLTHGLLVTFAPAKAAMQRLQSVTAEDWDHALRAAYLSSERQRRAQPMALQPLAEACALYEGRQSASTNGAANDWC